VGSHVEDYGVTLSLPTVVGRRGAERVLAPALSPAEAEALRRSAEAIRRAAVDAGLERAAAH
jgi:L-lactate dehydrogenase